MQLTKAQTMQLTTKPSPLSKQSSIGTIANPSHAVLKHVPAIVEPDDAVPSSSATPTSTLSPLHSQPQGAGLAYNTPTFNSFTTPTYSSMGSAFQRSVSLPAIEDPKVWCIDR